MKQELPLVFYTIVLNGMPFLTHHLPMMQMLPGSWKWIVVEGYAKPVGSTSWCKELIPMVSDDGGHEYLKSISDHPRVTHLYKTEWQGKDEMVNAAVSLVDEPCLLIEIDSDEFYESWQIVFALEMFKANPDYNVAQVFARYFVGPNIVITSRDTWGNRPTEFKRFTRVTPGMRYAAHEPPIWENFTEKIIGRSQMASKGIVMDHHSYETEAQVKLKEVYFGYPKLFWNWKRLQANTVWPVTDLASFMPHVGPGVTADLLHR